MAITLTAAAADRVKTFMEKRGTGVDDDIVFDDQGVKILVNPKSLVYLDGTELDYAREGLNEGFQFNNPNVKDSCGCGESFNV